MSGRAYAGLGAAILAAALMANAGAARAMSVPKPVTRGEATFVNGGIGQTEADAIRHMAPKWPVEMTFAKRQHGRDDFVAGVKLRVIGAGGRTVVDVRNGGPLLLLKLPDGHYTARADYDGHVKTQRIDIAAGHRDSVGFLWS
ncbi:MAG: hypothetical protein WA900_06135 [Casimicrobiaceae bacterium]